MLIFLSSYLSLYNLCYFCHYKKAPKRKVRINPFVQITLSTLSINGNTQLHFSSAISKFCLILYSCLKIQFKIMLPAHVHDVAYDKVK